MHDMRVFVDLDGVLADFVTGFKQRYGIDPNALEREALKRHKAGFAEEGFFASLPPFEGAVEFMQTLEQMGLRPAILTSVSEFSPEENARQKEEWVREHIGDYPFYWCQKSHEKAEHAAPNHILVDDRVKSVEPFVAAGGKAILHVDFPITLRALNEILGDL